eukprot:6794767-Pyramimonas_sp.AAC.1
MSHAVMHAAHAVAHVALNSRTNVKARMRSKSSWHQAASAVIGVREEVSPTRRGSYPENDGT